MLWAPGVVALLRFCSVCLHCVRPTPFPTRSLLDAPSGRLAAYPHTYLVHYTLAVFRSSLSTSPLTRRYPPASLS